MARQKGIKLVAENRRARHDYHLLDRYEAGLVLVGTEVKSLREGRANLARAYADVPLPESVVPVTTTRMWEPTSSGPTRR